MRLPEAVINDLIIDRFGISTEEKRVLTLGLTCAVGPAPSERLIESSNDVINRAEEWYQQSFSQATHIPHVSPVLLTDRLTTAREDCLRALRTPCPPNLTKFEMRTLLNLRNNQEIVIKKADKGASVVVWPTSEYIREGERQLSDTSTFQPVPDPTTAIAEAHQTTLNLLLELSDRKTLPKSRVAVEAKNEAQLGNIYFLPKVHKPMHPDTGSYKGRPIVSCCNGPTRILDLMLTKIFTPLLERLPERLRDTRDFISSLRNLPDPEAPPPFSLDIESLYPSIPQAEAIDSMVDFLLENREYIVACLRYVRRKLPPTTWIRRALQHTLQNNIFQFNGKAYRQIKGTSMGASISVALAEIFIHQTIERHPKRMEQIPRWSRYIDDIIVTPSSTAAALSPQASANLLNSLHPSINFTFEEANASGEITFLDTLVYRKDGKLHTKISYKTTDKHLYLHYRSFHPPSTRKALPFSQGLRVIRNTTDPSVRLLELDRLMSFFANRGYPEPVLRATMDKLRKCTRDEYGNVKQPGKDPQKDVSALKLRQPFPLLYDPRFLHTTQRTLKRLHEDLHQEYADLPDFPSEKSPMMAWRRTRNIKDILVRSAFPPPFWNTQ